MNLMSLKWLKLTDSFLKLKYNSTFLCKTILTNNYILLVVLMWKENFSRQFHKCPIFKNINRNKWQYFKKQKGSSVFKMFV